MAISTHDPVPSLPAGGFGRLERRTMSGGFLSYLVLSEYRVVGGEAVVAKLKAMYPNVPMDISLPPSTSQVNSGFLIRIDGQTLAVLFVDQPLPRESYQRPLELNRVWPGAAGAVAGQKGHVAVALLDVTKTHNDALNGAAYVTMVLGALAAFLPSIAVIWTEGETITAASAFLGRAAALDRREIPTDIWVDLSFLDGPPTSDGTKTFATLTSGLIRFVGREIEFLPAPLSPYDIALRVVGLNEYLITNGPVISDGETVGLTESEKIRVRFADAGQRPGVPVMQLRWDDPAVH